MLEYCKQENISYYILVDKSANVSIKNTVQVTIFSNKQLIVGSDTRKMERDIFRQRVYYFFEHSAWKAQVSRLDQT